MNLNLVLHVDLNDPQRLNMAFDNVANYMNYLAELPEGSSASIVLVGNGPSVQLFRKAGEHEALEARASDLMKKGLEIRLCMNALRKFSISAEELWAGCTPVSGGIPELVRLQNEGYSYIKP